MSRHTLKDGLTPDPKITADTFDQHLQILAPRAKLLGDYYKRGLTWLDYEIKYREYLSQPEIIEQVKSLAKLATTQDVTLLCVEDTPDQCHRRILAEECQKYEPSLSVKHR